jgi:hypothetical protein
VSLHVATVASTEHLPRARVLARSLREHEPAARFTALVLSPADEPFRTLTPEQLDCPPLAAMRARYDTVELACALKPWLIRHLLEEDRTVLYLDSDLRVYTPLGEMEALIERHGLVLSPHLLGPLPRDGGHPSEQDILMAGTYNAGLLGASRAVAGFVAWWSKRLETHCLTDPAAGLLLDQRWLDLAPGMVPDAHVLREPGWNVGLWDLPNRPIGGAPGAWTAAGEPLRCFHFAGFDPDRPDALSRHPHRADVAHEPALARLCRDYAGELLEAGHTAPDPLLATPLLRRLAREARGELRAWLTAPADRGAWAGLTRHLLALHAATPHLQAEFPDLDGPGALAYADWARAHAGEPELPAELVPPPPALPDGRPLDPLLLALFAERALPMAGFLAWLREPVAGGATRYLAEVHRARPDLRAAFPAPGPELVDWARAAGAHEYPLLGEPGYASSERAGAGSFE